MRMSLRELLVTALFIAIVMLATLVLKINLPSVNGYLNVGDSMIFVCAILVGPRAGFLAGSIGSALADLLLGASLYAPFTFVIKGIEGLVVGLIVRSRKKEPTVFSQALAIILGALWMWFGYFIAYNILYGLKAAIPASLGDAFQVIGSIVIGLPIVLALRKTSIFSRFSVDHERR